MENRAMDESDIDHMLLQLSDSLKDLQQNRQSIIKDPQTEVPNTRNMVDSVNQMTILIERLQKNLPVQSQSSEVVFFSWKSRPEVIDYPPEYIQDMDKCWTIAFYRGHYSLMKLHGQATDLTPAIIFDGVNAIHNIGPGGGGLTKLEPAITFMSEFANMSVYSRPKLDDEAALLKFEDLIEKKLREGPVVVVIDSLPSYQNWDDGLGLHIPNAHDTSARSFEKFPEHLLVLTGYGIENGIRFWQGIENHGDKFGEGPGYVKFARGRGVVGNLIVFEVLG